MSEEKEMEDTATEESPSAEATEATEQSTEQQPAADSNEASMDSAAGDSVPAEGGSEEAKETEKTEEEGGEKTEGEKNGEEGEKNGTEQEKTVDETVEEEEEELTPEEQALLELEVRVPKEMTGKDKCSLCDVEFLNPDMARQHYSGKKHAHKENQYIRKIYEEKGIDPTRFLVKPGALKAQDETEAMKLMNPDVGDAVEEVNPVDLDKYKFSCFLCGLHFELYEHVEMHVKTAMHALRIWEYQQSGYEDYKYKGPARARNLFNEWPADFNCRICDKELNSPQQWEQHITSKNHLRKEKNLMETGDPKGGAGVPQGGKQGGSPGRSRWGGGGGGGYGGYGGGGGYGRDRGYGGGGGGPGWGRGGKRGGGPRGGGGAAKRGRYEPGPNSGRYPPQHDPNFSEDASFDSNDFGSSNW